MLQRHEDEGGAGLAAAAGVFIKLPRSRLPLARRRVSIVRPSRVSWSRRASLVARSTTAIAAVIDFQVTGEARPLRGTRRNPSRFALALAIRTLAASCQS